MKQFWLICTCLCASYSIKGQSYRSADTLFSKGSYAQASILYEKAYFFNEEVKSRETFLLKKAECKKRLGLYEDAYQTLSRIPIKKDSVSQVVSAEKILMAYLENDAPKVENELLKYKLRFGAPISNNLKIIQFLNYVQLEKLEDARSYLTANQNLLSDTNQLTQIVPENLKFKSEKKARNLSMFFPGVGQMYAGYWFKGLVSGGVQAGLITFTAWSFYTGYFFTGTLSGAALFQNFYVGGIRYSGQLAERKNQEIKNNISHRFFQQIKNPEL
ncbi:MAG: hypothetical protein RIA69_15435 [Cyclobacteriaceae bacterium]